MTVTYLAATFPDGLRAGLKACAHLCQSVIKVGDGIVDVDWRHTAQCHSNVELPVMLLTAGVDQASASARWSAISLAAAIDAADRLETLEKKTIMALAGCEKRPVFDVELAAWIDLFDLDGTAFSINRAHYAAGREFRNCVTPIEGLEAMSPILRRLPEINQLAAMVVLALYNGTGAKRIFAGKRSARMNPPALQAFATLRSEMGQGIYEHLLRLIVSYPGW